MTKQAVAAEAAVVIIINSCSLRSKPAAAVYLSAMRCTG